MALLVREGLDQQLVGGGQGGAIVLHFEPFAHVVGKARPLLPVVQRNWRTRSARLVLIAMRAPI